MSSEVYFIKLNELDTIKDLIPKMSMPIGVKIHFGEEGNKTYIPAKIIKSLCQGLENPTFVETSVLYRSPRSRADTHRHLAHNHGFDFLPIDFIDGETGDEVLAIKSNGRHYNQCFLGKGLEKYNSLLVISHFKGHMAAGFGGALKNLAMGLASRQGKLAQHASIQHKISESRCIACGTCIKHCPASAIRLNSRQKAYIEPNKCISCSKCLSICPVQAIRIPWTSTESVILKERIAEYAAAAVKNKQCYYINFLINITHDCDCLGKQMEIITKDIGILASNDPVAIDQASYDLVVKNYPSFQNHESDKQLAYAEELDMGTRTYSLISK